MSEMIVVQNGNTVLSSIVSGRLATLEREIEVLKKQEEEIKKALLTEMEKKAIYKLETPELTVTFVDAFERESFDSKAFRMEHPEMYDEFVRFSPVKPSVRIKVR